MCLCRCKVATLSMVSDAACCMDSRQGCMGALLCRMAHELIIALHGHFMMMHGHALALPLFAHISWGSGGGGDSCWHPSRRGGKEGRVRPPGLWVSPAGWTRPTR